MNNRLLTATSLASTLSLSIIFVCIPSIAVADEGDGGRYGSHTEAADDGIHQSIWEYQTATAPGNSSPSTSTTAGDDTTRQSNEATPANPFGDDPFTHGSWVCAYPPPEPGQDAPQNRPPTTRELLLAAATLIHPDGAGLRKRPEGVSYTNRRIPTLVNVTHPTQTHTVRLLGRDITVTLTAQEYTWNWGGDTPGTVTSSPGAAWEEGMDPNTDPTLIRHYYTAPGGWKSFLDGPYPQATRTITLTTTWAGTATNPFTGDTQTINGLVTTTETTDPFRLDHLIINNTDTSEEKQGH